MPFNEWWPQVRRVLYNPIVLLILGVLGGRWISISEVKPVYSVSPVEVVARRESPRLAVNWDGHPVENLCICRVGLWNEGNKPITQKKLLRADPLRIVPSKPVLILAAEVANSSRSNLRVETPLIRNGSDLSSDYGRAVRVEITGGDALEQMDGVAIRIFFTGDCTTTFSVKGRIIDAPKGFVPTRVDRSSLHPVSSRLWTFSAVMNLGIASLGVIGWMIFSWMNEGKLVTSFPRVSFFFVLGSLCGSSLVLWLYGTFLVGSYPPWLPG